MIKFWNSPAKINVFLYITGIRSDGYHNIQTLFQLLNYGDIIYISTNFNNTIHLTTNLKEIQNSQNTIIKAAELLKKIHLSRFNSSKLGAKIHLQKKIPIGSGLGGGSSNAATTLIALNILWKTKYTLQELAYFGNLLGSDIPLFIMGKTTIAEGTGNIFYPYNTTQKWYLISYPKINISTKKIFSDPYLKRNSPIRSIASLLKHPFRNDCEQLIKKKFTLIKNLINWLSQYAPSRITGTGSCIFSEFNTQSDAKKVLSLLPLNVSGFITNSTNISTLHKQL